MSTTDAILASATREIFEKGLHSFSFDAFVEKLAAEGIAVRDHFADEPAMLRAAAVRTYGNISKRALASIDEAPSGADALAAYVRALVLYNFEHLDEFAVSMAQIEHVRYGITEDVIVNEFHPILSPPLDAVEARLITDRGSRELPGGIHPRRLAFIGQVMGMGLVFSKDLTRRLGSPLKHGDDALLREACRALAGPIKSLRQLSALNEAAVALARLRDEASLRAAVPALMASVLELESPTFVMSGERAPSDEAGGDVELTAHVRYEGEIVGVISGRRAATRETDERDVASIDAFASMVGLALENVRLYEDLQAQLEARTKHLTDAQRRLAESEKMAALGKLVAGVVHELNTPLGVAQSSHEVIGRVAAKVEDAKLAGILAEGAQNASAALHRISDLVAQLKRFSRLDAAEVEPLDIRTALTDAVALLRHETPEGCAVSIDVEGEGNLVITCFASRVNQVFSSLIRNAVQSEAKKVGVKATRGAGDVRITVRDDGRGIAAEDLPRIFEPGFTAKGGRVRAGLGLATAYQIVSDHGGEIRIESELGRGTCVTVVLPVAPSQPRRP